MNIQNWKNKAKEAGFQEEMKKLYGAKAEENGKRYEALLETAKRFPCFPLREERRSAATIPTISMDGCWPLP